MTQKENITYLEFGDDSLRKIERFVQEKEKNWNSMSQEKILKGEKSGKIELPPHKLNAYSIISMTL